MAGRRLTAVLAADIADYSDLKNTNDVDTVSALKGHRAVVLAMIAGFDGRVDDAAGSRILAVFPGALQAVKCAILIQEVMRSRNALAALDPRMKFRIGINQSDVPFDEPGISADAIDIAARLGEICEPGGIVLAAKIYDETGGILDTECTDIGEQTLKNIKVPVRAFKINLFGTVSGEQPSLPIAPRAHRKRWIAAAAILMLLCGIGVAWWGFAEHTGDWKRPAALSFAKTEIRQTASAVAARGGSNPGREEMLSRDSSTPSVSREKAPPPARTGARQSAPAAGQPGDNRSDQEEVLSRDSSTPPVSRDKAPPPARTGARQSAPAVGQPGDRSGQEEVLALDSSMLSVSRDNTSPPARTGARQSAPAIGQPGDNSSGQEEVLSHDSSTPPASRDKAQPPARTGTRQSASAVGQPGDNRSGHEEVLSRDSSTPPVSRDKAPPPARTGARQSAPAVGQLGDNSSGQEEVLARDSSAQQAIRGLAVTAGTLAPIQDSDKTPLGDPPRPLSTARTDTREAAPSVRTGGDRLGGKETASLGEPKTSVQAAASPSGDSKPAASRDSTRLSVLLPPEASAAIQDLDKKLLGDPRDVDARARRGQLYARYNEYALAKRDFDEILRQKPKDVEALNNRCWVSAILDELDAAQTDCDGALELRPNDVDALDSRGFVKLKLGKARDAIADYDAALKIQSTKASSLYGRGIAKRRVGRATDADSDIERAREINPRIADEFVRYGIR